MAKPSNAVGHQGKRPQELARKIFKPTLMDANEYFNDQVKNFAKALKAK